MATPLSDEIRALITFANETTEAGDTKLGDCVKTLCEGYNGGKNLPSSPLVLPQGAISSRLASLLAYANETTGAGDTTMGDAIRTLCEGYGGGELIFYEKLIGDGKAYINTGAPYVEGYTYAARLCIPQTTNSWVMGAWTGNKGVTVTRNGIYVRLRLNTADTNAVSIGSDVVGYHDIDFVFTTQSNISYTLDNTTINTGRMTSNGGSNVFLFGYSSGSAVGTYARNPSSFQSYTVKNESLNEVMHLVPCTYNGEAGMWDLVSQTFFGNAASSGQFTVEGEIVYYDRLIGDGTAYIDLGQPITANDRFDFGFKHNVANTNSMFGVKSSSSSRFDVNGRNGTNYKNLQLQYRSNTNRSIALANNLGQYSEGYIDLATLSAEFDGVASTFPDATATFPTSNLHLFTARTTIFNGYFSHFKWSRSGETVMDLKPCTYNGEAGMWDMVGWKFYGNSNTSGAFTAENDN